MIMSPGAAASIADWIVLPAAIRVGFLPPTVTVMASMDCLPLAAVITSSPHRAGVVPAGTFSCWIVQDETDAGIADTVPVIVVSLHETLVMATPPMVTLGQLPLVGQVDGRAPKP